MKKTEQECVYCDEKEIKDIKKRILESKDTMDKKWSAFIPKEPEIFGHIVVTYLNPNGNEKCIQCITTPLEDKEDQEKLKEILNSLMEGVRNISEKIKKITKVEKVYVVMAGEDLSAHIHFHLFPRYGSFNDNEIEEWAEEWGLSKRKAGWGLFYANPTKNFKFHRDLSYLGEIQQKYDSWKWYKMNGNIPSEELVNEMKDILLKKAFENEKG